MKGHLGDMRPVSGVSRHTRLNQDQIDPCHLERTCYTHSDLCMDAGPEAGTAEVGVLWKKDLLATLDTKLKSDPGAASSTEAGEAEVAVPDLTLCRSDNSTLLKQRSDIRIQVLKQDINKQTCSEAAPVLKGSHAAPTDNGGLKTNFLALTFQLEGYRAWEFSVWVVHHQRVGSTLTAVCAKLGISYLQCT